MFPVATAWVIDQAGGILATNAHVCQLFQQLPPGSTLFVRSTGQEFRDFDVRNVRIHPGFDEWRRLWTSYSPALEYSPNHLEQVSDYGGACDVGLLYVNKPDGLAKALPPAPLRVLAELDAGVQLGSIGYPMDGQSMEGVDMNAPLPPIYFLAVMCSTTFFDGAGSPADLYLVQSTLPFAGGSSGSPLVNAAGQVVAVFSGGDVVATVGDARIGSSAAIAFSTAFDLVVEMLDGSVERNQQERLRHWKVAMAEHYSHFPDLSRTVEIQKSIQHAVETWASGLSQHERFAVTTEPAGRFHLKLPAPTADKTDSEVRQTIELTAGGDYSNRGRRGG